MIDGFLIYFDAFKKFQDDKKDEDEDEKIRVKNGLFRQVIQTINNDKDGMLKTFNEISGNVNKNQPIDVTIDELTLFMPMGKIKTLLTMEEWEEEEKEHMTKIQNEIQKQLNTKTP